jgi:hypothetical protein
MTIGFDQIPNEVIDYVRNVFADANDSVSTALTQQPSLHEPGLDMSFIGKLNASPPAFFASSQAAVAIETHWLGGRAMYERWEIADISLFILLSMKGKLVARKVALLQTKRLYSQEIAGAELDRADYMIGIGRLVDRTEPRFPLSSQRTFRFDDASVYGALTAGSEQIGRIERYFELRAIDVYYGLYNPVTVPYQGLYPAAAATPLPSGNHMGLRVIPAPLVHSVTNTMPEGRAPSFGNMTFPALDAGDANSVHGWRIERFVADEVLRCRQGALFGDTTDTRLAGLLYGRSAPITAAIVISIDLGGSP